MSNESPAPSAKKPFGRGAHRARNHDSAHAEEADLPAPASHPLVPAGPPQLIDTQAGLLQLLAALREAKLFAYDSEFIGELTYVPKLCLIQVCWAGGVALIDPLASGVDVTPFWEVLADPSVTKIVHAGQQDVEPVARLLNRPATNIFDTQIAAGLAGLPYPLSLAKLVAEVAGAKLGKSLTFSHWDQRPLSPMQLRYAADDVRYLLAVYDYLKKRLDGLGHMTWALAESEAICQVDEFGFDPAGAFLRIRGATSLPPRGLAVLRELTIWRDRCARHHDLPPRAFLKDEILVDMARQPIKSIDKLARVKGLPRPVEAEYGQQIVTLTAEALAAPEANLPKLNDYEPSPFERFSADALWASAQTLAIGRGIDPNLVTSRQEIGELHRRLTATEPVDTMRIMTAWRQDALGDPLIALFNGDRSLDAKWVDGVLRVTK